MIENHNECKNNKKILNNNILKKENKSIKEVIQQRENGMKSYAKNKKQEKKRENN